MEIFIVISVYAPYWTTKKLITKNQMTWNVDHILGNNLNWEFVYDQVVWECRDRRISNLDFMLKILDMMSHVILKLFDVGGDSKLK